MKTKERGNHSRWVHGSFNKQKNLRRGLGFGGFKTSRSLPRILKVLHRGLNWFSHVYHWMVSITPYSLKALSLKQLQERPANGGGMCIYLKDRGRDESLIVWVQFTGQPLVMSSPLPPPTPYTLHSTGWNQDSCVSMQNSHLLLEHTEN